MPDTCLPNSDNGLKYWALMVDKTLADRSGVYGVSAERVAAFGVLSAEFSEALQACEGATRSVATTERKNDLRRRLRADARQILKTVNGTPGVTREDRIALGMTTRVAPRRAGVPEETPSVIVERVVGQFVSVRVEPLRAKTKPAGCVGFTLLGRVDAMDAANGHAGVSGDTAWRFLGNFTRSAVEIDFGDLPPGAKIWLTAEYMNTRLEPGPRATRVFTHLQGGGILPARQGARAGSIRVARAA